MLKSLVNSSQHQPMNLFLQSIKNQKIDKHPQKPNLYQTFYH